MQIQPLNNLNSSPSFGTKIKTVNVLEATTMKIFYNDGIEGIKDVVKTLNENSTKKSIGWRGYKYYAQNFGEQIVAKYPKIAKATNEINSIITANKNLKKKELFELIKPVVDKLGENVDITL
jgi:translation initiation factor 2 alpha subunit (eIF-2alpha)